ncbi:MAG TPA: response regulator [Steroidobacteraceae bacterium]|nr:response regulator [Steroidobacteraceae bacterium]
MDLKSKLLVVDDDQELRRLVSDFLAGHGYRVQAVADAAQMQQALAEFQPDVIILDVMMPGEDGLSVARRLAAERGPAVIILSALASDTDKIIGLEVGADDYLPKPCNPRELLARIRAVLRRHQAVAAAEPQLDATRLEFAGWQLDLKRRELRDPSGTFINLSSGEFVLLRTFVEHPQRVLSRDQLLEFTRGRQAETFDRAIDSQISRLRRKLNERSETDLIRTVRNEGYMLTPKVSRL